MRYPSQERAQSMRFLLPSSSPHWRVRMRTIAALSVAFLLYPQIPSETRAQSQTQKESGAITGTVKRDGKAASGIAVIATPSLSDATKAVEQILNRSTSIKATTDSEGVYRLEGLAPGKYSV